MTSQGWSLFFSDLSGKWRVPWDHAERKDYQLLPGWFAFSVVVSCEVTPLCALAVEVTGIQTRVEKHWYCGRCHRKKVDLLTLIVLKPENIQAQPRDL